MRALHNIDGVSYPFCKVCSNTIVRTLLIDRRAKCFIATAAFGSSLDPHVQILRSFRDEIVMQSRFKKHFERILEIYYLLSPSIARSMEQNQIIRKVIKYGVVYPFIYTTKVAAVLIIKLKEL
jgi:hypothetical protein